MNPIKLLIIEDNDSELQSYLADIRRFNQENKIEVEVKDAKTDLEALRILDNSFDGVIVDIRLDNVEINGLIVGTECVEGIILDKETRKYFSNKDNNFVRISNIENDKIRVLLSENEIELNLSDKESIMFESDAGGSFGLNINSKKLVRLKMEYQSVAGRLISNYLQQTFRVPIAILTGTPDKINQDKIYLGVFTKGKDEFKDILKKFENVYKTGLTKIFGGRGRIEDAMNEIFWKNIFPQLETWKSYTEFGKKTEEALLRITINHLNEFLDNESDTCFPEEMYIYPPISNCINTGSVVKKKGTEEYYIVLSPACDLSKRNGKKSKTDTLQLCLIENDYILEEQYILNMTIEEDLTPKKRELKIKQRDNANSRLIALANNNKSFYHYLPSTIFWHDSLINFRKMINCQIDDFSSKFDEPHMQISTAFLKDIVSRFSTYYARQGQPDFVFKELVDKMKN